MDEKNVIRKYAEYIAKVIKDVSSNVSILSTKGSILKMNITDGRPTSNAEEAFVRLTLTGILNSLGYSCTWDDATTEAFLEVTLTDERAIELSRMGKKHIVDDEGNFSTISQIEALKMEDKTDIIAGEILFKIERFILSDISTIHHEWCSLTINKTFLTNIGVPSCIARKFEGKVIEKIDKVLRNLGYDVESSTDEVLVTRLPEYLKSGRLFDVLTDTSVKKNYSSPVELKEGNSVVAD